MQKEICEGLQFMHDQEVPIIHRDIKPQNILLSYDEDPICAKISDFGVSALIDNNFRVVDSAGTLSYMSPECLNGIADKSNDLFSAGIIFYEMLTGHQPWEYNFENILTRSEAESALQSLRIYLPPIINFPSDSLFAKRVP